MLSQEFFAGRPGSYKVLIDDSIDELMPFILELAQGSKAFIITDSIVSHFHYAKLDRYLSAAGVQTHCFVLDHGEGSKSMSTLEVILEELLKNSFDRGDMIINLGGGVVSDIGGFAASVYMRGIRYVNIPTSLLAMVDSALGGKTGVDLCGVKNAVGAFYSPSLAAISTEYLSTLSERDIRSGIGEIIKYELIKGSGLLDGYLYSGRIGKGAVAACCKIKREYVEADLYDRGRRRILNLGHTFGHAFEAASVFSLSHGEAVALGLIAEARFGEKIGVVPVGFAEKVSSRVFECGLETDYSAFMKDAAQFIAHDKKRGGDSIDMPFCTGPGQTCVQRIRLDDAAGFLRTN